GWNALNSMHATLVLEAAIDASSLDCGGDFLRAAGAALTQVQNFHAPALSFRVPRIHAEQVRREQRGLVAARAGADLQNDVFQIVWILGDEEELQVRQQLIAARFERREFRLRELPHVRILQEFFGRVELRDDVLVLAKSIDERLEFRHRLRMRTKLRRVPLHAGVGHFGHQPFVLRLDGVEFVEHDSGFFAAGIRCPGSALLLSLRVGRFPFYPPETGGRNATSSPSLSGVVMRAYSSLTAHDTALL